MISKYVVRDVMSRGIYEVSLDTSLRDVIKTMAENNISSVVVTDRNGTYWGIITSLDVLKHYTKDVDKLKAEDIMVSNIITVDPLTPLERAAAIMVENRIHHLYVVSELREDKIVGVISSKDIIKVLNEALKR
ncbi:MAG TPA: CBS domain-containing protein [Methanococcaceae archaeon]|uniref:CBS domain-containing protein n=1 Tax=Methanothermococcus okinawensis TaxID=155863 RepID=A0A833E5B3_9EURY|nr:CBS domain-containing protein [Methanococcaceae archaeon]HIP91579.1 CBS domain-containing protein [Methanothermococcus okinawensis]